LFSLSFYFSSDFEIKSANSNVLASTFAYYFSNP
jgi:hypothetical protein